MKKSEKSDKSDKVPQVHDAMRQVIAARADIRQRYAQNLPLPDFVELPRGASAGPSIIMLLGKPPYVHVEIPIRFID
jgi:hypothetical protein